jgi:hypothetical protein
LVLELIESLHVRHDIPCLGITDGFSKLSLSSYICSLLLVEQLLLLILLGLIVINLLLLLLLVMILLLLLRILLLRLLLLLLCLLLLILLLGNLRPLGLHLRDTVKEFFQEYLNLARLP